MNGVEVKGVFNANAFFQTLGTLVAKKRGYDLALKSLEKAEEWTNVFHQESSVTPPAQDERAARPAKGRGKPERRVSA